MKIFDGVHGDVKKFYNQVEDITTKRPIVAITYTVALTAISVFISTFSIFLALGVFTLPLFFVVAMVKNFDKMCSQIETSVKEFFASSTRETAQHRGTRDGRSVRNGLGIAAARAQGFFEGITDS